MKLGLVFVLLFAGGFVCAAIPEAELRKVDQFESWAKLNNIQWSPAIKIDFIESFNHISRGVFATEDITSNEMILEVPYVTMMNEIAAKQTDLAVLVTQTATKISPTNLMALFLLYEAQQPQSKWKPYIKLLPKDISTTLFYTPEELAEFQNSTLIANTALRRENSQIHYEKLAEILWDIDDSWGEPLIDIKKFSLRQWQWALSVLWSRAFSVKIDGVAMGCLVPFADMFNAMDPYKQPVQVRAHLTGHSLQYFTTTKITAGEEIFMPYGMHKNLSNAELIMDYGYVRPDNPDDISCVKNPFTHPSQSDSDGSRLKSALFETELEIWRESYCWKLSEIPQELLWVSRVMLLQPDEIKILSTDEANYELKYYPKRLPERPPINLDNEISAVRAVIGVINRSLQFYATSLEEDEKLLERWQAFPEQFTERSYAALIVRMGEKRILNNSLRVLREYHESLSDGSQTIDNSILI